MRGNMKLCPFCGSEVEYIHYNVSSGESHIECLECAVLVVFDVDLDEEDIIAHWNTRESAEAKGLRRQLKVERQTVRELRERLDRLHDGVKLVRTGA